MKAYKGFNKDMTCRGFQYKEDGEYETERAELCECGFHACENPIDCLAYYDAANSVFHEVEVGGAVVKSGDNTKVAATKIKIGAKLSIPALCKATFEFVRSKCTNEKNAEQGKRLAPSARQRLATEARQPREDLSRLARMALDVCAAKMSRRWVEWARFWSLRSRTTTATLKSTEPL